METKTRRYTVGNVSVPQDMRAAIVQMIRYTTQERGDIIYNFYSQHPATKVRSPYYAKENATAIRRKVRKVIEAEVDKVIAENPFKCKCPECGANLASRCCLACDLREGRIKDWCEEF